MHFVWILEKWIGVINGWYKCFRLVNIGIVEAWLYEKR